LIIVYDLEELGAIPFKTEIIVSAVLTVITYGTQLLLGLQQYKIDRKKIIKQINEGIPPIEYFKPSIMTSNSLHYPDFLVGYMAWGFVICFHLILLILIGIRILSSEIRHVEIALGIIVPVIIIYLLKMGSMKKVGKYLFIQKKEKDDKQELKYPQTYAVFIYFIFFAGKIERQ
jgi:hypothetical protein